MDGFLLFLITVIAYVVLLLFLKTVGSGKKISYKNCSNSCPKCNAALLRSHRKKTDYFLNNITLKIFDYKRYICSECEWNGLRWEDKFQTFRN